MMWKCFLGIHKYIYTHISVWGAVEWGHWKVGRECEVCGQTEYYYITNRKEANRIFNLLNSKDLKSKLEGL